MSQHGIFPRAHLRKQLLGTLSTAWMAFLISCLHRSALNIIPIGPIASWMAK